jgi:hypothetical protein
MLLERLSSNKCKFTIHWISMSDDEIMQLAAYQFSKAFKKLTFITHIR